MDEGCVGWEEGAEEGCGICCADCEDAGEERGLVGGLWAGCLDWWDLPAFLSGGAAEDGDVGDVAAQALGSGVRHQSYAVRGRAELDRVLLDDALDFGSWSSSHASQVAVVVAGAPQPCGELVPFRFLRCLWRHTVGVLSTLEDGTTEGRRGPRRVRCQERVDTEGTGALLHVSNQLTKKTSRGSDLPRQR